MSNLLVLNLLIQTNPVVRYFLRIFHKDPFRGIYQANGFDLSILIPYFTILGILSIYGLHRYYLTFLYLKNRNKAPRPLERFDSLPRVTVQLPIYNERYVAERLLDSVTRIDYPREQLEIQVLDDSIDETRIICSQLVAEYARAGVPISYCHRENREGFKAGALAEGLKKAAGEFIAIFDADFAPPPSILRDMVHYFTDPQVAVVQGRWTWINRHTSNLTEVEAIMLDGHFVIEHGARNFSGRFFNFNGTAGMWRRSAIVDAGGWQHDTLTEDTDLSYRAQLKGWKFVYDPRIVCPSELPVEMNAFKTQQSRWAKGLIQTAKKLLPVIWRSSQPLDIKLEASFHLTANIAYPLMTLFALILLPAMIVRFYQGWYQMLYLDLPLFLASTCSVSSFYMVAQRELYPETWPSRVKYIPLLMATGIGLAVTNAKAVVEALLGIDSAFVRTPKYRVESREENWERKKYVRSRSGWIPAVELALGGYFLFNLAYSFAIENYFIAPFLALFFTGYTYTGMMSLLQAPLRRLWNARPSIARALPAETS
ncbi:MAG: glycosyl transferase family 2 [Acidobacteria bacterium 13_1_20CM_2_60_10]|nr:MAG: glycosyl transferase family 2 [Acidobacteria bacterium 13_1_20CM_2_60_10]